MLILDYDSRFVIRNGAETIRDGKVMTVLPLDIYDFRYELLAKIRQKELIDDTIEVSLSINERKDYRIVYNINNEDIYIQFQTLFYTNRTTRLIAGYAYHITDEPYFEGFDEQNEEFEMDSDYEEEGEEEEEEDYYDF